MAAGIPHICLCWHSGSLHTYVCVGTAASSHACVCPGTVAALSGLLHVTDYAHMYVFGSNEISNLNKSEKFLPVLTGQASSNKLLASACRGVLHGMVALASPAHPPLLTPPPSQRSWRAPRQGPLWAGQGCSRKAPPRVLMAMSHMLLSRLHSRLAGLCLFTSHYIIWDCSRQGKAVVKMSLPSSHCS